TGIDFVDHQDEQPDLALDRQGLWLHNLVWSTLDASAMTELYWWTGNIMNQPGPDGEAGLYEIYGAFYNFVHTLPLNNGHYQDAQAQASDPNLRVVGQKDLFYQNAHLWLQNRGDTWRAAVDGVDVAPITSTVTITGFQPGQDYLLQWWDTTINDPAHQITKSETITALPNGDLALVVDGLVGDAAVKIASTVKSPPVSVYLPTVYR
ncbi:MAG TPA: hypothetical protein PKE45_22725, partial [Caldilineaceae bacterium]|nr:hypothetical protein [Caldilineaceae bacterium]